MPITSETGPRSGSPVRGLKPEDEDDMGWEVGSMGDGPGVSVLDRTSCVTGCDFVFLRFEFLGGGLTVVEAITGSSDVEVRNPIRRW